MKAQMVSGWVLLGLVMSGWGWAVETTTVSPNPLQVKGQFRLRAEGNDSTDFASSRDFIGLRMRAELTYAPSSAVTFGLTPQFARLWGEPGYLTSANTGIATRTSLSGGTSDPSLGVHEAYIVYRPGDRWSLKPGRQILSYGNELVVGALDWNTVGRSFDALKARYEMERLSVDFFYSKLVDNNTVAPAFGGDQDFSGIYGSFQPFSAEHTVDAYVLYQKDSTTLPTHLAVFGIRLAGKPGAIDYRVEATQEGGNAVAELGQAYQVDAELGYRLPGAIKPRISGELLSAGTNYQQLYPTAHRWLGYADVLGRRNIQSAALHAGVAPTADWEVKVDAHFFRRASTDVPAYKLNGSTALGSAARSSDRAIGTEIDFTSSVKCAAAVTFSGGVSYFSSGDYLKGQFGDVNPWFYSLQMETKF